MADAPRLAVLISGLGRNLQAILDAVAAGKIPATVAAVVSNRADAAGLEHARRAGIPAVVLPHGEYADRESFDRALAGKLEQQGAELIAMAGFMRILSDGFIARFRGRMLNVHPSLLPLYRGLHTHRQALANGDPQHGSSVHFVTEKLDGGPVIIQGSFKVKPDDNEQTLQERVVREVETKIFPQALAWLARGELELAGDSARLRGRALARPLTLADLEAPFR